MKPIVCCCGIWFAVIRGSFALPGGAPSGACNTFTPRHADRDNAGSFISPQSSDSIPYEIRLSKSNFTSNEIVRVWITDTRTGDDSGYRGFLLQARSSANFDNGPFGTWQNAPAFTKTMDCSADSDAMTHSEVTNVKNEDTVFEWKAPCPSDIGDVVFTATIAQSRERFWLNVTSDVIAEVGTAASGDDERETVDCSKATRNDAALAASIFVALVLTYELHRMG